MTKPKGRRNIEHRLKEVVGLEERESDRPDDDIRVEQTFPPIYHGPDRKDRLIVRHVYNGVKQLVDFCMEQQIRGTAGQWEPVIRYDCAHGYVHTDTFRKSGGPPRKRKICDLDKIDEGCTIAEDSLYDHWEAHRRRYLRE